MQQPERASRTGLKVAVVGCGNVGVAAAYAIVLERLTTELVLVDLDKDKAIGEALDLEHAQGLLGRVTVRAGGYEDLAGAKVVVFTAGGNQKKGQTRLELLEKNVGVARSVMKELDQHCPEAVVAVATNPVDVLTYAMQEASSRPRGMIVGTGTMLDTSRLRSLVGQHYAVDPRSVHGYVLGEHGDSEVVAWSSVSIGGQRVGPLGSTVLAKQLSEADRSRLADEVRNAAQRVIATKGYTNLAIGCVISGLVRAILTDARSVLPVSTRLTGQYGIDDVCLSVPAVVSRQGVQGLVELELSDAEAAGLTKSANLLKEHIGKIKQ